MLNPTVSNPNDYKVVEFTNKTDFVFTPEMGCMFNGNPIFGITGAQGIAAGESIKLPYHVGQRLATNLAKAAITRQAPADQPGVPTGVSLWDTSKLEALKNSYLTDLYSEQKPVAETETERLMRMVSDLNKVVEGLVNKGEPAKPAEPTVVAPEPSKVSDAPVAPVADSAPASVSTPEAPSVSENKAPEAPKTYQDKAEVIAELEKRQIPHDKRKSKADLEKLLNA